MNQPWERTLDSAGFSYNPFTTLDIFGQPASLNLTAITGRELPVGADDSALPTIAQFQRQPENTGSGVPPPAPSVFQETDMQALTTTGIFIAILVVALWYRSAQ
jgi:hypothetical protein